MSDSLCTLFEEWSLCGSGCGADGYDKGSCVSVCSEDQMFVAKSLVDGNTDEPWEGATSVPATWEVRSMCYWLGYVGVDADGASMNVGDCFASCKNLEDLAATLGGNLDAVEAKADAAAALAESKQSQLMTCNDTPLLGGTKVPNCSELAAVETKADNAIDLAGTKQAQLLNCAGTPMPGGAKIPSCADMEAANQAVLDQVPAPYSLNDCDGAVIPKDTEVLTCAGFPAAFSTMLAESCLTLEDLGTQCGELATVTAIACGDGTYKLGIISSASSEYGTGGFDHHDTTATPGALWPADPDDVTSVMSFNAAENKLTAVNGVFADLDQADQDQLNEYRLFCAEHTAACDETIDLFVGATVNSTDENLTKSQFIYITNGVAQIGGAGITGLASFNNKIEIYDDTISIPVSAGLNTICVYLVRPDTSKKLTQFSIRNSGGVQRPRWRISKSGV